MRQPFIQNFHGKLWTAASFHRKDRHFELLISLMVLQVAALFLLFSRISEATSALPHCDIFWLLLYFSNCFSDKKQDRHRVKSFYTIPFFVYGYYISDYSSYLPIKYGISVGIVAACRSLFPVVFSETDSRPLLYSLISIVTIGFQLLKSDQIFGTQNLANISLPHRF